MRIYRYRSNAMHLLTELSESTVWYSKFHELNDPFEGMYINLSNDNIFDQISETLRVCCFSRNYVNLLMWAHYADCHRGACIEYEISEEDRLGHYRQIKYTPEMPVLERVVRYPSNSPRAGQLDWNMNRKGEGDLFLVKSKDWAYEEELRSFRLAKNIFATGEASQMLGVITGVYFGLRASPHLIKLSSAALFYLPDVLFWKASLVAGQFGLQFNPINRKTI